MAAPLAVGFGGLWRPKGRLLGGGSVCVFACVCRRRLPAPCRPPAPSPRSPLNTRPHPLASLAPPSAPASPTQLKTQHTTQTQTQTQNQRRRLRADPRPHGGRRHRRDQPLAALAVGAPRRRHSRGHPGDARVCRAAAAGGGRQIQGVGADERAFFFESAGAGKEAAGAGKENDWAQPARTARARQHAYPSIFTTPTASITLTATLLPHHHQHPLS